MIKLKLWRMIGALTLCASGLVFVGAGTASAAPISSQGTQSAQILPLGPSGCAGGYLCLWQYSNGNSLCQIFNGTANVGSACISPSDSIFNNSAKNVKVYYGAGNTGAFWLLTPGQYLDTMTLNKFNQCNSGSSCPGYNTTMANNVRSLYFYAV